MRKNGHLVFTIGNNGTFDIESSDGKAVVTIHRIGEDRFKVAIQAPREMKIMRQRSDIHTPAGQ